MNSCLLVRAFIRSTQVSTMEHTNTEYKSLNFIEHVRVRPDMYLSSLDSTTHTNWVYDDDHLEMTTYEFSMALFNICDEIILNAADHVERTSNLRGKNKCTQIGLSLCEDGSISVFNNGEGITIAKQGDVYIPEMIFSRPMSGSNFGDKSESAIAGANGLGCKLTSILSSWFTVETMDAKSGKLYTQTFEDGLKTINAPTIVKAKSKQPFTRVTFMPDYAFFKLSFDDIMNTFIDILSTRMLYLSVYFGKRCTVMFNEESIPLNTLKSLAALVSDACIGCNLVSKEDNNTLEMFVAVSDSSDGADISLINGLFLERGGSHLRFAMKALFAELKPKMEKLLKGKVPVNIRLLSQHLTLIISGKLTDLHHRDQSKSEIVINESRFKNYTLDKSGVKNIWKAVEEKLTELYLNKVPTVKATRKLNELKGIPKYFGADLAGTARSHECALVIPEGDSAQLCVRNGLSAVKTLGFSRFGLFNIQGVPLNVRKAIDVRVVKHDGSDVRILNGKKLFQNNERINSLMKVLNLNMGYAYDQTEEGNAQFSTLRYGSVIISCDQDVDGIGQICALILNFFDMCFPALLSRGFVKIFVTPLVRAYPTKRGQFVKEFYNIEEYNSWSRGVNLSEFKINYIKGLAGHSNTEIKHMFEHLDRNVFTFVQDTRAAHFFEAYFGTDPDMRKTLLSDGRLCPVDKEMESQKLIPCSNHLNSATKEYQLDNIQRKMVHEIDGLNPARRKVLAGSIRKFKTFAGKMKVFQLGGYIAQTMAYHHGSDSLNNTIINMAQDFIGARNIPLLLPIGQFGSHYQGGNDAGSPRYIDTRLNRKVVDLLFPSKDNELLEYCEVDGALAEPRYFIPIIPMALLEDVSLPSTGWKIEVWARDLNSVIKNVLKLIDGDRELSQMPYWSNKFTGTVVETDRATTFVGKYRRTGDKIRITSLPPRMWIDKYVEQVKEMDFVKRVKDNSTVSSVDIEITLNAGAVSDIIANGKTTQDVDPIQYALKMYSIVSHHINLYTTDNGVKHCDTYEDAIWKWFSVRKDCYIRRIERERIILRCKLLLTENMIRFIQEHAEYRLSSMDEDRQEDALSKRKYTRVNHVKLNDAGLTPNDQLEEAILVTGASYGYLLGMNYKQMSKSNLSRLQDRARELAKQLKELEDDDVYKTIWKAEIDALMIVLEDGVANGFYKEDASVFAK